MTVKVENLIKMNFAFTAGLSSACLQRKQYAYCDNGVNGTNNQMKTMILKITIRNYYS